MEIIISIAAILLIVSLYDHLSSKSWQQITSSSRNDVVFDKRNKEYGAYEIRRNYDKTLVFIMLGVVMTIGASYGAYLYTKALPVEEEKLGYDETPVIFDVPEDEKIEDIEIITPPDDIQAEELENQLTFTLFEVTDDVVNASINTQDAVDEIKASDKDVTGNDEPKFQDPKETKNDIGKFGGKVDDDDDNNIVIVDEDAEYPGGRSEMMKFFSQNLKYPEMAAYSHIEGQAKVRFIVEKNGTINDVKVLKGVPNCPECDKEAVRVVSKMPQWKPGKANGRAVRSYYHMPITFKLKN